MQILSLRLEDVKSYENAEIVFTPGTNAIVGQNGAGKSTVLEAIGFALFDSLGYRQRDFVREGAKSATITVTFVSNHDERQYQVVRRCGSSTQYYIFDPELDVKLQEGKADVQGFLREHMGVETTTNLEKLFSDAVGVPQGTFTAAFLEGRAERKSKFDALLQVREYEEAWSRLREPAALLRNRQQELDVEIAGMAARLEQLPVLEASLARQQQEVAAGEKQLAATVAELETVQAARKALDGLQQELAALREQRSQLDAKGAAAESQLSAARRQLAESEEAAAEVARHQDGHDAYEAAQSSQKELDQRILRRQQLRDQRVAVDKTLALAQAEVRTLSRTMDEIVVAERQVETLQSLVVQQEELESARATEQQRAATFENARQELTRQLTELKKQTAKAARLKEQLAEVDTIEATKRATELAIAQLDETLQHGREALAELRVNAEKLKEQNGRLENIETSRCPVCEQPLTPDHRDELLERNGQQIIAMRASYQEVKGRNEADEAAHKQKQQALRDLDVGLRRLPRQAELDETETSLALTRAAVAEAEAAIEALADVPERLETLQQEIDALGNPRQQMAVAQAAASRRAEVEERQARNASLMQAAEVELAAAEEALAEFRELDEQAASVSAALQQHAPAHHAVLTHRRLADGLEGRKSAVEALAAEVQAVQAERQQLATAMEKIEADFDEERHRTLLGQEQTLAASKAGLETQLTMLRRSAETDEQTVSALQVVAAQLASLQAKRNELAEQEQVLEDMRAVVRQAGPFITRALVRQIGDEAARIFGEIMQDHSRHLSWDEEYLVSLNVDGNERQFGQLSGGEQMSAAIAVRLALLRQMSNIDIAFFDEPTTNLDTARRESLAQQILTVDGLAQLFIISHDDTFEQATENLIRVERVNGASRVAE